MHHCAVIGVAHRTHFLDSLKALAWRQLTVRVWGFPLSFLGNS
jgi:hypothetical protein